MIPAGSSPHTRGALGFVPGPGSRRGIIPAYAGSTYHRPCGGGVEKDHPRIRGEHSAVWRPGPSEPGSSPHTRGARPGASLCFLAFGIIPAYAGSTWPPCGIRAACRDHPRIRGEHLKLGRGVVVSGGSSPHTRGAHRPMRTERPGSGIIPAYAGSTARLSSSAAAPADHPRIRGEHIVQCAPNGQGQGSSPHTRGARRG